MELTMITRMGDRNFEVRGITLVEALAVRAWTTWASKDEWIQAFNQNDSLAIQAAYAVAIWRETGTKPALKDLDFNLDDMDSRLVDETGATVIVKFEQKDDGTLALDKDGKPVVRLGEDGKPQFFYADTDEPVPPTPEVAAKATTSLTPVNSGSSSVSRSQTGKSAATS